MAISIFSPVVVKAIPEVVREGELYISAEYGTAVHKCACGCGLEVVTPLSPVEWRVTVQDGRVSLYPSIGNWSFPCRSHYWIQNNAVRWAAKWTDAQIAAVKESDRLAKVHHYDRPDAKLGFWQRLWRWFTGS